ncbi:CRISPR-associated endonuclease Cas1 [uncultured Actinomyces sp.]|uniref:CRISPR-associated endonuclease Cas1 n=1 Tax=uncultured Actinomyces sp. TaxID=249061 RepID=UPI0028F0465C|nr:CRISPR-associated endonuclease Cas1 [uncultured Actinomyces sp.]
MTTPATASSLREATSPEALTRARRRLLTAHPDPTRANTSTPGSLTDDQRRVLAASDWAPPRIAALDTNAIATADPITRALLAESVRETLERRLTAERPHGTYDDTHEGHNAFSRGVTDDYDHGNHHLARATIRPADPGLVTRAALSALGLPDTDATIIDELAQASDPNPIMRVLADAALLDLDRYATGRGLRYSRVGTTLILAAPSDQRLVEAIDAVAAAAINAGARVTDLTTQHIDEEKALARVGIDPWTTRPSDEPAGQADRILYVGRDGAHIHIKAGRVIVDAPGSLPSTSVPKNSVTRIVLSGNVGLSAGARSWAMRSGVDVVCLSRRGSYQGALIGANRGAHASRLLAQVALTGDRERRVRLAASLIGAKIRGQIHVLTRIARRDQTVHVADTTAHMHAWRRSLTDARTLDEIMGIEGACSNAYFDALSACVPADVTFNGRSRRPPRDLPNAALSYGYAILLSECVGALHAAGLEASLGIAHAPTDKRPSLALDLMEQFRPLLVDQTVMALLRTRKLRPEHGVVEAEAGGVWLGADGKKNLVDAYEAACQRSVTGALPGYSGPWRRHITHSAQMLARAIAEPDYEWSGVAWR